MQKTSCTIHRNTMIVARLGSFASRLRRLGLGVLALALALTAGLAAPASAGTKLQGTKLQGTKLQGTKLQGTKLQGTKLQGTKLQGTKLQGTKLQGTKLQGTKLQGTKLQGTKLQGTALRASKRPMHADLVRSVQTCHARPSSAHGFVIRQASSISIAAGK